MIHLSLLVRQLACSKSGSLVDNQWRLNLEITGLAGLVEEELDKGTLQTCALAHIDRETCSRDLHAQVKVDEVVFLGQVPMG